MIASRLAGMRPPYPRHPLREFTPCAPGRSIQQYFPVSSGTGSRIQFLQCNFHPRRPTGVTTDCTDLTDNVRTMPLQKPPVSVSSVKSVVFFCLRVNRSGKKPPRRTTKPIQPAIADRLRAGIHCGTLGFLLVNTKRFSPQRHKDTKSI